MTSLLPAAKAVVVKPRTHPTTGKTLRTHVWLIFEGSCSLVLQSFRVDLSELNAARQRGAMTMSVH
jgi:hypothetical protein